MEQRGDEGPEEFQCSEVWGKEKKPTKEAEEKQPSAGRKVRVWDPLAFKEMKTF
jgi:hypothetical protein